MDDQVLSPAAGFTRCLTESAWIAQQQGRSAEALTRAREAENILRAGIAAQSEPTENRAWQLAEMKSRLGGARVVATVADKALQPAARAREFASIEPLLLESEELLRENPAVHSNWKRDAVERLVRLYQVWNEAAPESGKLDLAAQWKQRLASSTITAKERNE